LQDALNHRLAHLVRRLLARIDVFHVVTESDSTEDKSKHYSHEADIAQLDYIDANCLENVSDFGNVTEDIHDVQEIDGRIEESSEESDKNINQHSVEFTCLIERLRGVTAFQCLVNQL
jgi:hypothetical protein